MVLVIRHYGDSVEITEATAVSRILIFWAVHCIENRVGPILFIHHHKLRRVAKVILQLLDEHSLQGFTVVSIYHGDFVF